MQRISILRSPMTGRGGVSWAAGTFAGLAALVGFTSEAAAQIEGRERQGPNAVRVESAKPEAISDGPLTLVVSIRDQKLSVYSGTEQIARVPVSTGQRGYETPTGIFSVIQKARIHYSNLYESAPMPFMQRLTWSGVAMHAGLLPGYPASHGCVRLPQGFASRLFAMTRLGTRVVVAQSDVAPEPVDHPLLAALAPGEGASPTFARAAHPLPGEPMWLGGAHEAGAVPPTDPTELRPETPAKSLLAKANQGVAARTAELAVERAAKVAAARRLEDAAELVKGAREALRLGRAELAKAEAQARRAAAEVGSMQRQNTDLLRATADPSGDPARMQLEDWLFLVLVQARQGSAAARDEVNAKAETLQEIAGELTTAEASRAEIQRQGEKTTQRVKRAEEALQQARRDLAKRQRPVTLFVSRTSGKLYVRQGFEPLLEASVTIAGPDTPIGTHVLTAVVGEAGGPVRWTAVTVPTPAFDTEARAAAALDRLVLSEDVKEQLEGLVKVGASLILSDHPLSRETGIRTDLIVETR